MSETSSSALVTPPEQDFDTASYRGSMQQILQENIGNYVIVEFLIGTGSLNSRQGILYDVGSQFLVLYDDINLRYVVCDIFSVKFVTFLLPGYRPGQIPSPLVSAQEEAVRNRAADTPAAEHEPEDAPQEDASMPDAIPVSARLTPSRAAYSYAVRKRPVS